MADIVCCIPKDWLQTKNSKFCIKCGAQSALVTCTCYLWQIVLTKFLLVQATFTAFLSFLTRWLSASLNQCLLWNCKGRESGYIGIKFMWIVHFLFHDRVNTNRRVDRQSYFTFGGFEANMWVTWTESNGCHNWRWIRIEEKGIAKRFMNRMIYIVCNCIKRKFIDRIVHYWSKHVNVLCYLNISIVVFVAPAIVCCNLQECIPDKWNRISCCLQDYIILSQIMFYLIESFLYIIKIWTVGRQIADDNTWIVYQLCSFWNVMHCVIICYE